MALSWPLQQRTSCLAEVGLAPLTDNSPHFCASVSRGGAYLLVRDEALQRATRFEQNRQACGHASLTMSILEQSLFEVHSRMLSQLQFIILPDVELTSRLPTVAPMR